MLKIEMIILINFVIVINMFASFWRNKVSYWFSKNGGFRSRSIC